VINRKEQFSVVFFVVTLLAVHHYFFYPPVVEERRANDSLYNLHALVAAGDRQHIQDGIMRYLSEDTYIRLEVTYTGLQNNDGESKPAIAYEFNKSLFKSYLGNMLSSLSNFAFAGTVQDFDISGDWKTAKATIVARGAAQGKSRFMTKQMNVRFSFDAICEADLNLTGSQPLAQKLNCKLFVPPSNPL